MDYDALVAESRREKRSPRVSTRFSLGTENKQADAGWDSRAYPARPNYQAQTETRENSFPLFS